ncbi:MAG: hypothetical protein Q9179_006825 [Wetmoreana sp. 5 TL-2023]
MDCNQNGIGPEFDLVFDVNGKQYVLAGLPRALPGGFTAINYAKDTHYEKVEAKMKVAATSGERDMHTTGTLISPETVEQKSSKGSQPDSSAPEAADTVLLGNDVVPSDQTSGASASDLDAPAVAPTASQDPANVPPPTKKRK